MIKEAQRYKGTKGQRGKGAKAQRLFMSFPTPIGNPVVFLLLILFLTFSFSFFTAAHAANVDETVDMIQKKFKTIKDINGNFSQTSYIKDLEDTQKFSGTFFLMKPSRMMWEYSTPRDEKIIINDTETWIHKRSENQVIKTTFSKEAYSQVPIAMLQSFENIRNDFDITMPEENALQLMPKRKMGFIKTLVLETATDGFPIKMFTIIDTYGNIIMIELENIKTNVGLDASIFIFKVPQGAEVFDMTK